MQIITPRIDVGGERWFTPIKNMKPIVDLKLQVASIDNHQYRSKNALIRRHIDKLDAVVGAGTKEFNLSTIGDIDSVDDLLIDNCAQHLLVGWEGVGELVDGKEVAIEYSPEKGAALLKQQPELYWQILSVASEIAVGKKEQEQETVKKPSKHKRG